MPTPDPNEKMENLLRAYAKKRREEAGASFELSPDVRARLQDEVRRSLGKSAAPPRRVWGLWPAGWHWLAPLGGVAVVVVILLTLRETPPKAKTPVLAKVKKDNTPALMVTAAAAPPAPALSAAPPPPARVTEARPAAALASDTDGPVRMTNHLLAQEGTALFAREITGDSEKLKTATHLDFASEQFLSISNAPAMTAEDTADRRNRASAKMLDSVNTSNTFASADDMAQSPAGRGNRGAGRAGGGSRVGGFDGGGGGGVGGGGGALGPVASDASSSIATSSGLAVSGGLGIAAPALAPPGNAPTGTVTTRRAKAELSPAEEVLTSFQIERVGAQIHIEDADGSIYEGQISSAAGKAPAGSANELAKDATVQQGTFVNNGQIQVLGSNGVTLNYASANNFNNQGELPPKLGNNAAAQDQLQTVNNVYTSIPGGPPPPGAGTVFDFQASGLNRKLNQTVTIRGTCAISPLSPNVDLNNHLQDQEQVNKYNTAQKAPPASQSQNLFDNYHSTQTAAPLLQVWHVTGQVQVGPSNHFDLDAATLRR